MYRLDMLGPVALRRAGQTVALPTHKVAALLVRQFLLPAMAILRCWCRMGQIG
jgi:hypothetical protein